MKILLVLACSILTVTANAATWTFHTWQDNFTDVTLGETFSGIPWHYADLQSDPSFDSAFPESPYSGVYWWDWSFDSSPAATVYTITTPDDWWITSFYVAQGYPGYNGSWVGEQRPTLPAGEYWVDFASDGSYRVSATEPDDFGKWAWDGSINPSWVEHLSAVEQPGKKLGHRNKKP
jgi:hypothetical protein